MSGIVILSPETRLELVLVAMYQNRRLCGRYRGDITVTVGSGDIGAGGNLILSSGTSSGGASGLLHLEPATLLDLVLVPVRHDIGTGSAANGASGGISSLAMPPPSTRRNTSAATCS